MASQRPPEQKKSADELYQEARDRWAKVVDLGLYDDDRAIYPVTSLLERARKQDSKHVKSLALLSDLMMELGADDEASELITRLLELEPDAKPHREKMALLKKERSKERRDEIRDYLETKWNTDDW
jgi:hypothetical protein